MKNTIFATIRYYKRLYKSNYIMKKTFLTFLILATTILSYAQNNNKASNQSKVVKEQAGRPDIPGDLFVELGFSLLSDAPESMDMSWWGSKALNIYYQYPMNIGKSSFSFHPGIGIGTEKYAFDGYKTLDIDSDGNTEIASIDSSSSINKSKFGLLYLDIPLEIRWRSNKYDPRRGFNVAIGVKGGILLQSKTKVKYSDITYKEKRDFNIQTFRYGAFGKFGFGSFNLYYYYSLSQMFESGKGPDETETFPMQVGISFALF